MLTIQRSRYELLAMLLEGSSWANQVSPELCSKGKSLLLPFVGREACKAVNCLVSKNGTFVHVNVKVAKWDNFLQKASGNLHCQHPSGGQNHFLPGTTGSVSVIFTVHDNLIVGAGNILRVYLSLHEVDSAELVVVDDGSESGSTELRDLCASLETTFAAQIQCIRNHRSVGFGAANNQALTIASGQYAVLLNSDIVVQPGWLAVLLWTKLMFPEAGIVGPMMLRSDKRVGEAGALVFKYGRTSLIDHGKTAESIILKHAHVVDYVSGACILFERELFLKLNLFDPSFFPAYYEDTDAALMFLKSGLVTVLQPFATVFHDGGGTYSPSTRQSLMHRNKHMFWSKHKDWLENICPFHGYGAGLHLMRAAITLSRQGTHILVVAKELPIVLEGLQLELPQILTTLRSKGYGVMLATVEQPALRGRYVNSIHQLRALGIAVIGMKDLDRLTDKFQDHLGGSSPENTPCIWDLVVLHGEATTKVREQYIRQVCPDVPIAVQALDEKNTGERGGKLAKFVDKAGSSQHWRVSWNRSSQHKPEHHGYIHTCNGQNLNHTQLIQTIVWNVSSEIKYMHWNTQERADKVPQQRKQIIALLVNCTKDFTQDASWLVEHVQKLADTGNSHFAVSFFLHSGDCLAWQLNFQNFQGRVRCFATYEDALSASAETSLAIVFQSSNNPAADHIAHSLRRRGVPLFSFPQKSMSLTLGNGHDLPSYSSSKELLLTVKRTMRALREGPVNNIESTQTTFRWKSSLATELLVCLKKHGIGPVKSYCCHLPM